MLVGLELTLTNCCNGEARPRGTLCGTIALFQVPRFFHYTCLIFCVWSLLHWIDRCKEHWGEAFIYSLQNMACFQHLGGFIVASISLYNPKITLNGSSHVMFHYPNGYLFVRRLFLDVHLTGIYVRSLATSNLRAITWLAVRCVPLMSEEGFA